MKQIFPVHLFSLPDTTYIRLEENFRKRFFAVAIKIAGNKSKLSKISKSKYMSFSNWIAKPFCPLKIIKTISGIFENKNYMFNEKIIEKHVLELRGKTMPFGIKKPKLPIELSEELACFLGHLYADGGIKRRDKTPLYCNVTNELIDEFLQVLKIFGDVDYTISVNKKNGLIYITLPTVLGNILVTCLSFPTGKKSKNKSVRIPDFIRNNNKELIQIHFLRALFDDECHVNFKAKTIRIEMANKRFIEDARFLLRKLGFYPSKVYVQHHKYSKEWYFSIHNKFNFRFFEKKIGFTSPSKREVLSRLISSHMRNPNPYILLPNNSREKIFKNLGGNITGIKFILEKKMKKSFSYMTIHNWYYGKSPIPLDALRILLKLNKQRLPLNKKVKISPVANCRYKFYLNPHEFRNFMFEEG